MEETGWLGESSYAVNNSIQAMSEDTSDNGYPVIEFEGTYYTKTAETILKRINEIRLEACREGVINPSTGKPLTVADYNPIKWSSDLEEIARVRAAEATLYREHIRPNGNSCFTVISSNGESSWAENLAWNYDGIMYGIEQWYSEKSDWVNKTGAVTGHYTSLINPNYNYVAIGAFKLSSGWYTIAQEFSFVSSMDETKNTAEGKTAAKIEISDDKVKSIKLDKTADVYLEEGSTYTPSLNVSVEYDVKYTGALLESGAWSSSDETVAIVDKTGTVTAKKNGTARISISLGDSSAAYTVNVYNPSDRQVQEIEDAYYTGKAYKPSINVYMGDILLKLNTDYKVTYQNNINANKNGKLKKGDGTGDNFDGELPYAVIKGTGKYFSDEIKVNFNILPAVIGDGSENVNDGITLKYTDQFVTNARNVSKPFKSIKGTKAMKLNTDFTLKLKAEEAYDASNAAIAKGTEMKDVSVPAGYSGSFVLEITGQGNYSGSICKTVYVAEKSQLMKNAKITLGKNIKKVNYKAEGVTLTPSDTNTPDTFTVKFGKDTLTYPTDYTVSYRNNDRAGKAELIITGIGKYTGTKTVTFQIIGKAFNAKKVTVTGISDKTYTGKAITQNDAVLKYEGDSKPLVYGTDYTISYTKNINKGTATMTFKGSEKSGYSGSFKKTFKIK